MMRQHHNLRRLWVRFCLIGTFALASILVCEGGVAQDEPNQQEPNQQQPNQQLPAQPAERPPEVGDPLPVSQLTPESDRRLEEILDAAYGQVQALSEVQAAVDTGVVTLLGEVPRPRARENAEAIARKLEGVLFVNNQLEESFATQLAEVLKDTQLKVLNLKDNMIGSEGAEALANDDVLWKTKLAVLDLTNNNLTDEAEEEMQQAAAVADANRPWVRLDLRL